MQHVLFAAFPVSRWHEEGGREGREDRAVTGKRGRWRADGEDEIERRGRKRGRQRDTRKKQTNLSTRLNLCPLHFCCFTTPFNCLCRPFFPYFKVVLHLFPFSHITCIHRIENLTRVQPDHPFNQVLVLFSYIQSLTAHSNQIELPLPSRSAASRLSMFYHTHAHVSPPYTTSLPALKEFSSLTNPLSPLSFVAIAAPLLPIFYQNTHTSVPPSLLPSLPPSLSLHPPLTPTFPRQTESRPRTGTSVGGRRKGRRRRKGKRRGGRKGGRSTNQQARPRSSAAAVVAAAAVAAAAAAAAPAAAAAAAASETLPPRDGRAGERRRRRRTGRKSMRHPLLPLPPPLLLLLLLLPLLADSHPARATGPCRKRRPPPARRPPVLPPHPLPPSRPPPLLRQKEGKGRA